MSAKNTAVYNRNGRRRVREKEQRARKIRRRRQVFLLRLALAAVLVLTGTAALRAFFSDHTVAEDTEELYRSSALAADAVVGAEESETDASDEAERYPEALITMMEKYPETTQFVKDYFSMKDAYPKIDISADVTKGTIPLFIQWDARWGYKTYGSGFFAVTGCGPTSLSMVYCGLTGDTEYNPYRMGQWAEDSGYYVWGVGSSWEMMTAGAESLGLTARELTVDAESLREALLEGCPVICSMGPGDFTDSGHFIVLTGMDWLGNVKVHDPNSRNNSEKTWDMGTLVGQMKAAWCYSYEE